MPLPAHLSLHLPVLRMYYSDRWPILFFESEMIVVVAIFITFFHSRLIKPSTALFGWCSSSNTLSAALCSRVHVWSMSIWLFCVINILCTMRYFIPHVAFSCEQFGLMLSLMQEVMLHLHLNLLLVCILLAMSCRVCRYLWQQL